MGSVGIMGLTYIFGHTKNFIEITDATPTAVVPIFASMNLYFFWRNRHVTGEILDILETIISRSES